MTNQTDNKPEDRAEDKPEDKAKNTNEKPRRKIAIDSKVTLIVNPDTDSEQTEKVYRNRLTLFNKIKDLPDDSIISIIESEDVELSEPPAEGEEPLKLVVIDKLPKKEAMIAIASTVIPEGVAVNELFRLIQHLSVFSTLSTAAFAVVFNKDNAGQFVFESPYNQVEDVTVETCIKTLENLKEQYTKEAKNNRPLLNVGNSIIIP